MGMEMGRSQRVPDESYFVSAAAERLAADYSDPDELAQLLCDLYCGDQRAFTRNFDGAIADLRKEWCQEMTP